MASDLAKSLFETEKRLWNEVQGMHKVLVEESREFNTDETIKFENLHNEIDSVNRRLKTVLEDEKRSVEAEKAYNDFAGRQVQPEMRAGDSAFAQELRSFANGEQRAMEIAGQGSRFLSKFARGPMSPTEARAVVDNYLPGAGTSPGSFTNPSGAGIVPIDFYDQLVSYLVEVSGIMQTGPTVHTTQGGEPLQIPVVTMHTGYTTANYTTPSSNLQVTGQGATLLEADPSFGQDTLTAQKFGQLIKVSRELIDDSGINLLQYLASSAGRALGNSLGSALINGSNGITSGLLPAVSKFVTGASAGNTATGQVPGGPSYANLIDMQYSVIAPYRQSRSTYWLAADATLGTLRKLTDLNGRPLWEPSVVLGAPDLMLGKPIVADPFMPALNNNAGAGTGNANVSILFGDFSQFVIRLVGGVRFERSDDFLFNQDLVAFRTVLRADATYPLRKVGSSAPQAIAGFYA